MAHATPALRIEATVDPALREIRGTLWLPADWRGTLVDPLPRLPEPVDDLRALRTYPGPPDRGDIVWVRWPGARVTFVTRLPRRFGALGATRHGLFANGGWYPQPVNPDGRVPSAHWQVTVTVPEGATGALGTTTGTGALTYTGTGERVGLAVVPGGTLTPLAAGQITLLSRRPPGRARVGELEAQLGLVPRPFATGAVVLAPQRRRLVRHGPGLAFLSDRAFRLTPGTRFAHRRAVLRGLLAAWIETPDPFEREFVAAAMGELHEDALRGSGASGLLAAFSWIPQVNALLAGQRTPFYAEILDRAHPGDPVRDDLLEILDPYTAGAVAYAQVDDRYDRAPCMAAEILHGASAEAAAHHCGVDVAWAASFRQPYPDQDYRLDVEDTHLTITRDAPAQAAPEPLVLRINGAEQTLLLAPGLHTVALPMRPRSVVLDPQRHIGQRSRVRDTWPARYDVTLAAGLGSVNLSQGQVFGALFGTLRRQYDTHNLLIATLSNSRANLVSAELDVLRKEGPLLDGWRRPHRLRIGGGASVLNPGFAATDGVRVAVDASASWAHDTRVNADFPLRGHRLYLGTGGGLVPGTGDVWASLTASATGIVSWHPRHALALRSTASVARSALPHRLLTLGGARLMRSIPTLPACVQVDGTPTQAPCTELASERAVALIEYRTAALRNLSVPLGLVWGSELQLSAGAEAMAARLARADGGQPVWATGATLGLFALGDVLGAEAMGLGVTAAWPVAWHPALTELQRSAIPEIYVGLGQAF